MSPEKSVHEAKPGSLRVPRQDKIPLRGSSAQGEQRPRGGSGRFVFEVWSFITPHPSSLPAPPFLVATITSLPDAPDRTVSPRLLPLAHSFAGEVWSQVYHHPQPASSLGVRKALPFLTKFQATARREGASHLPFILDKASEVLSTEPEGAPCFLFLQCCLWKVFFLVLPPLSRPLVSKDYSIRGKNLG